MRDKQASSKRQCVLQKQAQALRRFLVLKARQVKAWDASPMYQGPLALKSRMG